MASKKTKTEKSTTKATRAQQRVPKKNPPSSLEANRKEAEQHEEAGRWKEAAEAWEDAARVCTSKTKRKDAAGRAAAARVRANAKRLSLDAQLANNATAESNRQSWDNALPDPGYVPPSESNDDSEQENDETVGSTNNTPSPDQASRQHDSRLPPAGTVIIKRDRLGKERARCTIVESGIEYGGTIYKSISGAAMAAAKDLGLASKTQDGYAFWQLKSSAHRSTRDLVELLEHAWQRYRECASAAEEKATSDNRDKVQEALNQHLVVLKDLLAKAT
jgi:hypothetical protein